MNTIRKIIIPSVLALLIALSLVSCGDTSAPSVDTVDDLVFTPIETDGAPGTASDAAGQTEEPPAAFESAVTSPVTDEDQVQPQDTEANEDTAPEATDGIPAYVPAVPTGDGNAPLALMYHLVLDQPFSSLESLFVRPSELRGHIEALLEKGYTFIFADDYDYYSGKTVIMSFDDGYLDNYTEVFPIIKEYNVKITIFMISNYINGADYLSADMIKEMSSSGLVSFQSHTASHPDLTTLSADSLRYEFKTSNEAIESLTGRPVRALCYPTGANNAFVQSVASEYYDFAYTTVSTTSTAGYGALELPRLRVNRGFSKDYFLSIIP